eukprot:gene5727-13229_t
MSRSRVEAQENAEQASAERPGIICRECSAEEALTPESLRKTLLKKKKQNGKQNAAEAKAAPDDNRK